MLGRECFGRSQSLHGMCAELVRHPLCIALALRSPSLATSGLSDDLDAVMQATVMIALLQPAPEVYNLFDDILLLAEGCVIFHGPKDEVLRPDHAVFSCIMHWHRLNRRHGMPDARPCEVLRKEHNARLQVMPFFNSMGFSLPERKGIADFLQEVTSEKDQAQYW